MSPSNIIILADTNIAYNLYWFVEGQVIQRNPIYIGNTKLVFHPIVLEEVEGHYQAWLEAKELDITLDEDDVPSFFDTVGKTTLLNVLKFIEDNLDKGTLIPIDDKNFREQRKIYESTKNRLQKEMKQRGETGKKVTSNPSMNDYKLLYSADVLGVIIATNDGILHAIASELLEEDRTYNTEKILKSILAYDPTKEAVIQNTLTTLDYLGRKLNRSQIF